MKVLLVILSLLLANYMMAQNEEIDLESFAERLFEVQDENISYEDIYESLLVFYSNKLNLNKVEPEELASLYILSPAQINGFYSHIAKHGKLLSIHELQTIEGFDLQTIKSIMPFATVEESAIDGRPFLQRILDEENNYLLLRYSQRLEQQVGYTPPHPLDITYIRNEEGAVIDTLASAPRRYRGNAGKVYGRFRTSHKGDFSLGFTFEKDAGEKFEFSRKQKGFDFYSYHLLLENKLGFDKILLGDFQLQIGQGLVYGAGFSAGKGAETVNSVKRNSLGLRPYTSVLETGFFRGIGLTKSYKNFNLITFYSKLSEDANIQNTPIIELNDEFLDQEEFINSIQGSGLHRTDRELSSKNIISQESLGFSLEYKPKRQFVAAVSALNSRYSLPLLKRPNNYNQFEFQGEHNFVISTSFSYSWENFSFFGEGARSNSGGMGGIGGLIASLSPKIDFALLARSYDRDFHSFYARAFSENSRAINEQGIYWGLQLRPQRKHKINLYYDRFVFPWLKFRTEAPSDGYEYLFRYTYNINRQISLYAQVRQQERQVSEAQENVNVLVQQIKRNYLLNIDYQLKSGLDMKTRVQSSTLEEGKNFTKGFALIQDVNFPLWKLKCYTRMALFDTDDFGNVQYVYENDVLYAFSIPAYAGSGIRNYVMIRYDPFRDVSLWIRYAQTTFPDASANSMLGSGLEATIEDKSSELKLMMRMRF